MWRCWMLDLEVSSCPYLYFTRILSSAFNLMALVACLWPPEKCLLFKLLGWIVLLYFPNLIVLIELSLI